MNAETLPTFRCHSEPASGVCARAGIVPAVHGVSERPVDHGEGDADHDEEEQDDPAHPCESDQRSQEAASLVHVAPVQLAPVVLLKGHANQQTQADRSGIWDVP